MVEREVQYGRVHFSTVMNNGGGDMFLKHQKRKMPNKNVLQKVDTIQAHNDKAKATMARSHGAEYLLLRIFLSNKPAP